MQSTMNPLLQLALLTVSQLSLTLACSPLPDYVWPTVAELAEQAPIAIVGTATPGRVDGGSGSTTTPDSNFYYYSPEAPFVVDVTCILTEGTTVEANSEIEVTGFGSSAMCF